MIDLALEGKMLTSACVIAVTGAISQNAFVGLAYAALARRS